MAPECGGRDNHCSPVLCASLYLPSSWQLGEATWKGVADDWERGDACHHGQASDALSGCDYLESMHCYK